MKKLALLALLALATHGLAAQKRQPDESRIEAMKVGLITQRLELTPEQSKNFWPVYNKFSEEMRGLREEMQKMSTRGLNVSDEELKKEMERMFELREKEVATHRKYHKEFLKVISVRQTAELYRSEQQFRRMLLERLGKNRPGGGPPHED